MKANRVFHVLVVLTLSSVAGRKKLNGIHRFLNEGHDWDIELVRDDADFFSRRNELRETEYDGILASSATAIPPIAADYRLPSVYVAYPQAKILADNPFSVFLVENEKAIAHAAVGHLTLQCHGLTLAYVPTRRPIDWSDRRQAAFASELAKRGHDLAVFSGNGENRPQLADWIRSLPKPAGILAAYDDRARDVIETCREIGLAVPEEISVLGIGNDGPICEMSRPGISSVEIDFELQGYRAARELQAMMLRRRKPTQRTIFTGIRDIVLRASTAAGKSDSLATRAMDYIAAHAPSGITPADVVHHLNVSRSLAYLRFREAFGTTILEAILDRRLAHVKRLLETSDRPIAEIAVLCGYKNANYLKNQFRRTCGMSMRDWRRNSSSISS